MTQAASRNSNLLRRHSSQARDTLDLFRGAVSPEIPSNPCAESLNPIDTVLGEIGCRGSFTEGPGWLALVIGETIGGRPRGMFLLM